jgi:RNA polymerase sigma-70 factor (ECF subfamily)
MHYVEKVIETDQDVGIDSAGLSPKKLMSIVNRGLPSLHQRAYRVLGNKADAEDAVQDALLAAWTHLKQFRGDAQLSTWLTAIVINSARMQVRKRPRYGHMSLESRIGEDRQYSVSDILADNRPNPEDECHKARVNALLTKCAAQLSPALQKAFLLRYVHQLSFGEIARALGLPIGTVKNHLARGRAKLLKAMRGVLHGSCRNIAFQPARDHELYKMPLNGHRSTKSR